MKFFPVSRKIVNFFVSKDKLFCKWPELLQYFTEEYGNNNNNVHRRVGSIKRISLKGGCVSATQKEPQNISQGAQKWGVRKLTGCNLKVIWTIFSILSLVTFVISVST